MAETAKTAARPLRSALYMPGSNARAMEKAKTIAADAVILDLEDAVAPEAKEDARAAVCAAVKAGGYGKRVMVIRANALGSEWGKDDIRAAVAAGPDAILVPKVNSAEEVAQISALMDEAGAPAEMAMWAMMETPLAMLNAQSIAAAAAVSGCRLSCFVMGTNDIAKEIFCEQTEDRAPLMTSLSLSLLAARAYGLNILDGVYNDIANADGFKAVSKQGADLGFDGKTLIHPTQVLPCNEIFAPSEDEVTWSRQVIAAFEDPANAGKGVLKVEGKMAEILHAEIGKRVVAIADAIAELEAAAQ